jgi:periplasmic nitrate reductase NapD
MNISGVLVHAKLEQVDKVKEQLVEIPGVEVHATTDNGRLVVTIEHENDTMIGETVVNLHNIEGVLSAAMVYQYGDDEDE